MLKLSVHMRPFLIALSLAVAPLASATAQSPAAAALPAALLQAVAATEAAKAAYAFDLELASAERNWQARFDPNGNPRLRLVSPSRETLDNDERRGFDRMAESFEGVSWCASENMGRVANVRLMREDETSATYSFQPTRESVRGEQARRFADRMRGEVTVTKATPDITRVRLFIPAAFSPMPLVRVDAFNVVITCQAAPNGRRYAAETTSDVRGSAFGQDFNERSVQRARNLSAP
jgi:hypothetical protein